jgi:hypothetical protein
VKHWKPDPTAWQGQEAFVFGGGTSLDTFNPSVLADELVVGCNDAFLHGPVICDICVFGDYKWYNLHAKELRQYVNQGGIAVSNEPKVNTLRDNNAWLRKMQRQPQGVSMTALGWNCNTGAGALNLALILGAARVFLLGFDMQLSSDGKRSNWHENTLDKPRQTVYDRMMDNFKVVSKQLPKVFPGREVINVNDYTRLDVFPIVSFDGFWEERKKHGTLQNRAKEAS